MLALLSQNAKQLLIALPADAGVDGLAATRSDSGAERGPAARSAPIVASRLTERTQRSDLFAKTLATLTELRRDHLQLEVRQFEMQAENVSRHRLHRATNLRAPEVRQATVPNGAERLRAVGDRRGGGSTRRSVANRPSRKSPAGVRHSRTAGPSVRNFDCVPVAGRCSAANPRSVRALRDSLLPGPEPAACYRAGCPNAVRIAACRSRRLGISPSPFRVDE